MLKKVLLGLLALFFVGSAGTLYLSLAYPADRTALTPPTSSGVTSSDAAYTASQVAAHSRPDDCWLIVRGNVYDVTRYIPYHPGGRRRITSVCGREVTSVFAAIHSNRAWDLLGDYRIGTVGDGATASAAAQATAEGVQGADGIVAAAYPDATVLSVHPFGTGFVVLIADGNRLTDVVVDAEGAIVSQQTRRDELEWFWQADDEAAEWRNEQ